MYFLDNNNKKLLESDFYILNKIIHIVQIEYDINCLWQMHTVWMGTQWAQPNYVQNN